MAAYCQKALTTDATEKKRVKWKLMSLMINHMNSYNWWIVFIGVLYTDETFQKHWINCSQTYLLMPYRLQQKSNTRICKFYPVTIFDRINYYNTYRLWNVNIRVLINWYDTSFGKLNSRYYKTTPFTLIIIINNNYPNEYKLLTENVSNTLNCLQPLSFSDWQSSHMSRLVKQTLLSWWIWVVKFPNVLV